jgi:hypothetical protein
MTLSLNQCGIGNMRSKSLTYSGIIVGVLLLFIDAALKCSWALKSFVLFSRKKNKL